MKLSKSYFKTRLNRFQRHFSAMGVDGFIIEDPVDLFYFTGIKLSRGRLLISTDLATLFVDGRYQEVAKKSSPYPVKSLNKEELGKVLALWEKTKKFGFDTTLSVVLYREIKTIFSKNSKMLKGFNFPTQKIRSIKDSKELVQLKSSSELLWKGFLFIKKKLKGGITEKEIAHQFEHYVKEKGAEALSFEPIIAFGENSALPHHRSSNRKLKKGDVVLIDIGVVFQNYASDMTRVLFWGKVPEKILEMYQLVKKAHQAALEACKPGVKVNDLDRIARKVMGKKEKHFIHALGHGIGLEVHEYPRISSESKNIALEEGMVITIEPGLYLPNLGGIRYEDMVVITKTGYRNLFKQSKP